ncbi:MAG: Lrp/AsnC family transcriptional regulator [Anaerolineales bacterium]|nr:Lrp/AsnC family transcriptional regulator [Anaerolineales bacterium]
MNMYQIDNIDAQIVNLLNEDGRMSCAEIARRIGAVSQRMVGYRIDRMIAEGLISITSVINPKLLGYTIVADVWLEVESDSILEVAQKMTEYECITYVACSIGETDVSVQVVGKTTEEIYRFVTEVIGKTPGVRKTTTSIVPLVLKDTHQWQIPGNLSISSETKET